MKKVTIILLSIITLLCSACAEKQENEVEKENNDIADKSKYNKQLNKENYTPLVNTPLVDTDLYESDNDEKQEILLGDFKTKLNDKNENRVFNIKLACEKITGTIVSPGEVFSFNETVGEANYENGFKTAKVLINKEIELGEGGGICQVSTTIYNAADKAGLEIVEVNNHSKDVSYVEKGRDATVAYGSQDFKFKNNQDEDIKIDVSLEGNTVQCKIIGYI